MAPGRIDDHPRDFMMDFSRDMMVDNHSNGHTHKGVDLPVGHFYISEIVDYWAKHNSMFCKVHDIRRDGIYVKTKLSGWSGRTKITRFVGDIDVWDLYRVFSDNNIGIISSSERYKNIDD